LFMSVLLQVVLAQPASSLLSGGGMIRDGGAALVVNATISDLTNAFKLATAPESKKYPSEAYRLQCSPLRSLPYPPVLCADVAFLHGGVPAALWDYPFVPALPTSSLRFGVKLLASMTPDTMSTVNNKLSQVLSPESYLCRERCWTFALAFGPQGSLTSFFARGATRASAAADAGAKLQSVNLAASSMDVYRSGLRHIFEIAFGFTRQQVDSICLVHNCRDHPIGAADVTSKIRATIFISLAILFGRASMLPRAESLRNQLATHASSDAYLANGNTLLKLLHASTRSAFEHELQNLFPVLLWRGTVIFDKLVDEIAESLSVKSQLHDAAKLQRLRKRVAEAAQLRGQQRDEAERIYLDIVTSARFTNVQVSDERLGQAIKLFGMLEFFYVQQLCKNSPALPAAHLLALAPHFLSFFAMRAGTSVHAVWHRLASVSAETDDDCIIVLDVGEPDSRSKVVTFAICAKGKAAKSHSMVSLLMAPSDDPVCAAPLWLLRALALNVPEGEKLVAGKVEGKESADKFIASFLKEHPSMVPNWQAFSSFRTKKNRNPSTKGSMRYLKSTLLLALCSSGALRKEEACAVWCMNHHASQVIIE
jgi:hypothetical protein